MLTLSNISRSSAQALVGNAWQYFLPDVDGVNEPMDLRHRGPR